MDSMRRFDPDLLQTLVAVADAGSLSAAAPQLCRSQSAVSEQLRKLEEMCGLRLFSRGKTGATLTPAGERLLIHARKILAMHDIAYQDMQGVLLAGDLRLAITDYFRPASIAGILKRIRSKYPRLRLHVSIRKSALIEQDAVNGEYDIGLSMRILDGAGQHSRGAADGRIRLRREPLSWVADASLPLEDMQPLPLIVLPSTCSLQQFIVRMLEHHGVRYEVAHSASGVGGLHLALAAGLGVSCLNDSAIPSGVRRLNDEDSFPPLPDVEFSLLPPRPNELPVVTQVREMLAQELL